MLRMRRKKDESSEMTMLVPFCHYLLIYLPYNISMKCVQVQCPSDVCKRACKIAKVDIPVPKEGEILIRLKVNGCCHTDIHAISGDWPIQASFPLTPGHEGIGEVVVLGTGVTEFVVRDRVGIAWLHSACGSCEYCCSGWETLCLNQRTTGYSVPGCMSEYVLAVAKYAVKIPAGLSDEQAAPIMCAGLTAYKAIKETEARPGQFLTIIGAGGGLGHMACQYGKAMGLRVLAVDLGVEKQKFCESMGVEKAYNIQDGTDYIKDIITLTGGGSHAILMLSSDPTAFKSSFPMCRSKGTIVCVGISSSVMPVPLADLVVRRITVRGSIVGTRQDMQEALDFAERGLVQCHIGLAPLDQVNEVLELLHNGHVRGRMVLEI